MFLSCFIGDGCGYTVLGPESGTFTSINYPYAYPNSTVCEWEIRVKPEQRVQLKFGDFDIDDSDSCHFNYVRVYNGIGPTRTEIGKKLFPLCVLKHFKFQYDKIMIDFLFSKTSLNYSHVISQNHCELKLNKVFQNPFLTNYYQPSTGAACHKLP